MQVYLDNSATTQCSAAAAAAVSCLLLEDYGNPSSLHQKGTDAEKHVKAAAAVIAKTLHCREKEIVFTSGGTESNNLAIIGSAMANQRSGKHIITTCMEHPSVMQAMLFLKSCGYELTILPADQNGVLTEHVLEESLRPDTILVSMMMVNNEIGAVLPIAESAKMIHEKSPAALFHVDAVQAYGKYRINPKKLGVDLLSASGHKIHGPKGVGFLYIREKAKIRPIAFGGGQQNGLRSGTMNAPGIAGLGAAAAECYTDFEGKMDRLRENKNRFVQQLLCLEDVKLNGPTGPDSAPHIVNASFLGVRSEVLLHALEDKGISVSAGSACSSAHPAEEGTLPALGYSRSRRDSALRFSFSTQTTQEELDYTAQTLRQLLPVLRRYTRK